MDHHTPHARLRAVKTLHTLVWAFFAGSVVLIPVFSLAGDRRMAWILIAVVAVEVAILLLNRMRCPLTDIAGRYTRDRNPNFDIYLPEWLARHNKTVFGLLYLAGVLLTLGGWTL